MADQLTAMRSGLLSTHSLKSQLQPAPESGDSVAHAGRTDASQARGIGGARPIHQDKARGLSGRPCTGYEEVREALRPFAALLEQVAARLAILRAAAAIGREMS